MAGTPQDTNSCPLGDPSSEVGSGTTQDHAQNVVWNDENKRWQQMFEMQQRHMMELIRAIKDPNGPVMKLTLPEFNPNECEVRAWCNTVDLCIQDKQLTSIELIMAMSKSFKGPAASWLAQNSFAGITWPQLKDLLLARYESVETPAATLFRLLNECPKEGECLSSYANRFLSILTSRWQSLNTEQIAIAVTMAHAAKFEPRLQRLAFTTEIDTRVKMQQELMAFTYRKRGSSLLEKPSTSGDNKRPRLDNGRRCYSCGKIGHLSSECRSKNVLDLPSHSRVPFSGSNTATTIKDYTQKKPSVTPTCYYCGEQGHVATHCKKKEADVPEKPTERRVNVCTIKPATDTLYTETDIDDTEQHEDV